jgi:hypothetical protein
MVFRASPAEYKIDRWEITPPSDATSVLRAHVSGRPTGFVAAVLNVFGMSRRLDLRLTTEAISIETSSLSASGRTTAPLNALSSFTAVRTRSILWPAVCIVLGGILFLAGVGGDGGGGAAVIGLLLVGLGAFWYARSGKLGVSASVASGVTFGFVFNPGTTDGVTVDESSAYALADLATALVLGQKQLNLGDPAPVEAPSTGVWSGASASTSEVLATIATGWYTDPHDSTQQRYWDGTTWTEEVRAPS